MSVLTAAYLLCALAFGSLFLLVMARRQRNLLGDVFLFASLATVVWALSIASAAVLPRGVMLIAEDIRGLSWLVFLGCLLGSDDRRWHAIFLRGPLRLALAGVATVAIGADVFAIVTASRLSQLEILGRLGVAVLGLFMIENLYRGMNADRRWHIKPLVIAFGGIFAFDLYLYSDTLLFRRLDPSLLAARAIVNAAIVPLLALALARNKNWRVSIRVSRNVAFHGITLVASGIFLLSVAVVGTLFRRYGGDWSVILQVTLLFGSAIVLAVVLTSATMRQRVRHFVLKNFFPYRYDYRIEWNNFIEALASPDGEGDLPERIIRAIARIVSCPGGILFHRQNGYYLPIGQWNARIDDRTREPEDSALMQGFRQGQWIQILAGADATATETGWQASGSFRLAVPLTHRGEMIGFVALSVPPGPLVMDWEVFDLLRTVGRQAASYLAEQEAATALSDARLLRQYSQRFAFVVHDIKNLSSQLALVVSNARQHGNDPEFLRDAWMTIANSVDRMNKLLSQLRERQDVSESATDAAAILHDVVEHHPSQDRIRILSSATEAWVRIDGERLHSALTHLINNAIEASGETGHVRIGLEFDRDRVVVNVSDEGFGMDARFVRDQLFRPFRSTKDGGLGIGAFQTRELIQSAGGQLQVISNPGTGTTMRVILAGVEAPKMRVA
jgi:putative PEP-CTERM system histidine kinase